MTLQNIKATLTTAGDTAVDDAYALGLSAGSTDNNFAEETWGVVRNDKLVDDVSSGKPLVFTGGSAQAQAENKATYMATVHYMTGAEAKELKFV